MDLVTFTFIFILTRTDYESVTSLTKYYSCISSNVSLMFRSVGLTFVFVLLGVFAVSNIILSYITTVHVFMIIGSTN